MRRFFVEPKYIGDKMVSIVEKEDLHHLVRVLRLSVGDEIVVSDSSEWEYRCRIDHIEEELVEAIILDKQRFAGEPAIRITLFQGVTKHGKTDVVVQKATELGVDAIVPVFMDRSVVSDKGNYWKKVVRFRNIAGEAAKQCRRGMVPDIRQETDFDDMVARLGNYELVVFPYEEEDERTIKDQLKSVEDKPKTVAIVVGPEGGFSSGEVAKMQAAGYRGVKLCNSILRTETAGPVAIAMCLYEFEI